MTPNSYHSLGLRQLRRRGGGWFVEAMKDRDLNELKAAIVAYEEIPYCPEARTRLYHIRLHCVGRYSFEEVKEATIEAYQSIHR